LFFSGYADFASRACNRGPVPLDDPRRVAAAEYTWLLATARENGVSTAALVQATNSPWRTLKARLRRHQVISTPPSTKPYQSCQYVLPPIVHRAPINTGR